MDDRNCHAWYEARECEFQSLLKRKKKKNPQKTSYRKPNTKPPPTCTPTMLRRII